jgi:hypothetical protein
LVFVLVLAELLRSSASFFNYGRYSFYWFGLSIGVLGCYFYTFLIYKSAPSEAWRVTELTSYVSNSLPLALFFSLILFYTLSSDNLVECDVYMSYSYTWDGALVGVSHISSIGNIMYTSHSIWLIITGFILLLAMVGAIVISLGPVQKTNDLTQGLSR